MKHEPLNKFGSKFSVVWLKPSIVRSILNLIDRLIYERLKIILQLFRQYAPLITFFNFWRLILHRAFFLHE